MNVNGVSSGTNAYSIVKQTKTDNVSFETSQTSAPISDCHHAVAKTIQTNSVHQQTSDPVLDYYHAFCEQYPGVSFRLGDREEELKNGRCMGYKDSMNSVGENYGSVGQCSVTIDVKVIQNMMENPKYAFNVHAWMEHIVERYPLWEEETQFMGMKYTDVVIEDDDGSGATWGVGHYNLPFSTEEEIRAMWAEEDAKSAAGIIEKQLTENTDMFDRFLEMFDQSQEKHREMIREYYDKLRDEDGRHFPEQKTDAGLDEQKKAAIHKRKAVNEYDKHFAYDNT